MDHPRKASARLKAAMDLAGNAHAVYFQAAEIYLAAQKERQAEAALLRTLDYPGISREEVFLEAFTICCDRQACELTRYLVRRAKKLAQELDGEDKAALLGLVTAIERAEKQGDTAQAAALIEDLWNLLYEKA